MYLYKARWSDVNDFVIKILYKMYNLRLHMSCIKRKKKKQINLRSCKSFLESRPLPIQSLKKPHQKEFLKLLI